MDGWSLFHTLHEPEKDGPFLNVDLEHRQPFEGGGELGVCDAEAVGEVVLFAHELREVVEVAQMPQLFKIVRQFDRMAVADKQWIRPASEIEGSLFPGLTVKAFDSKQEAEAWLVH